MAKEASGKERGWSQNSLEEVPITQSCSSGGEIAVWAQIACCSKYLPIEQNQLPDRKKVTRWAVLARTGLPAAVLPIQFGRPLSDGSFVGDWFRLFLGQSKSPRRTRTAQGKHSLSPQTDHKSTKDCSGNAFPFCDLRPFNRRFNQLRSGETTGNWESIEKWHWKKGFLQLGGIILCLLK